MSALLCRTTSTPGFGVGGGSLSEFPCAAGEAPLQARRKRREECREAFWSKRAARVAAQFKPISMLLQTSGRLPDRLVPSIYFQPKLSLRSKLNVWPAITLCVRSTAEQSVSWPMYHCRAALSQVTYLLKLLECGLPDILLQSKSTSPGVMQLVIALTVRDSQWEDTNLIAAPAARFT